MKARRAQPRGFILLAAIAILAIVGVAILALAAAMSYDGRRTMERAQRVQLDQMLLAGWAAASAHLPTAKTGDAWEVDLPESLIEQQATLKTTVESADASSVVLNVRATLSNRSAEQTLRFQNVSGEWKLSGAEIPSD